MKMIRKLEICVGSLNPTKYNAVVQGFKKYFSSFKVIKIKANSNVPDQPIGMKVIIKGAINRAREALYYLKETKKENTEILGVGIEAGLVEVPYTATHYMDFQFCVIMDDSERITMGSGIAFEYPARVINQVISNKKKEIGDIMGELTGNADLKNEGGAISFLSKGILKRTDILTQAVICALLPRINEIIYNK